MPKVIFRLNLFILVDGQSCLVGWRKFWNKLIPLRVLVFCWVASMQKILTMDHLRRRKYMIVNWSSFVFGRRRDCKTLTNSF